MTKEGYDMKKTELDIIINDAVNDAELKGNEIPAIDLYVDQIINLVTEKQKEGSERFKDRQLTKTMINNYSKDGVIAPVKGKKYSKEQILQILTVYTMKNTLSIGEIKRILDGAYAIEGFDGSSLSALYARFMDIKDDARAYAPEMIDQMLAAKGLDVEHDEDFLTALYGIVSLSAYLKSIARAMIDEKYPEPITEEEQKEEEKDKKKKEKEKAKEAKEKVKDKKKS